MKKWAWIALAVAIALPACRQSDRAAILPREEESVSEPEQRLVLENATLSQEDSEGQLLWELSTESAVYSSDRQSAELESLQGKLLQDGEVFMQVQADRGEVLDDGKQILLLGNVVATDPRNSAVVRCDRAQWIPDEDLFLVQENLRGRHPRLLVSATQGRYLSRQQSLTLEGDVVATTSDPQLQLKSESLLWEIEAERVTSDRPVRIDRFAEDEVSDRLVADTAEVDLVTQVATLTGNLELQSADPPLQIATNAAIWETQARLIRAEQPIEIVDRLEELRVRGNRGRLDLATEVARLSDGARGISGSNGAELFAQTLVWELATERLEAEGNVIYEQQDPPLRSTGASAEGRLQDESIVVRGGSDRVVTEIIP